MYRIYTQSRSNHKRGFTGTLLRSEIRSRSGHTPRTLVRLVSLNQASQHLGLPTSTLHFAAKHRLIPHYPFDGRLHFDPVDLDRWVRDHRIDEFADMEYWDLS